MFNINYHKDGQGKKLLRLSEQELTELLWMILDSKNKTHLLGLG